MLSCCAAKLSQQRLGRSDSNPLVRTDGEQVLAVSRDEDVDFCRDGAGEDQVIVGIAGYGSG
jgi:hypothetical protein